VVDGGYGEVVVDDEYAYWLLVLVGYCDVFEGVVGVVVVLVRGGR